MFGEGVIIWQGRRVELLWFAKHLVGRLLQNTIDPVSGNPARDFFKLWREDNRL